MKPHDKVRDVAQRVAQHRECSPPAPESPKFLDFSATHKQSVPRIWPARRSTGFRPHYSTHKYSSVTAPRARRCRGHGNRECTEKSEQLAGGWPESHQTRCATAEGDSHLPEAQTKTLPLDEVQTDRMVPRTRHPSSQMELPPALQRCPLHHPQWSSPPNCSQKRGETLPQPAKAQSSSNPHSRLSRSLRSRSLHSPHLPR